jgi:peptidoglycan DL-endopeptidase CwlO
VQRAAEAQEATLLSKQYTSKQYASKQYTEVQIHADVVAPVLTKPANFRRKSNVLSVAACAIVLPGLLATIALPAYGATQSPSRAQRASISLQHELAANPQTVSVVASADQTPTVTRASFAVIAPVAPPVAAGSSMTLVADPAYPGFDLSAVLAVASQYIGVPYIFGGESPSGFDCSGLVAYVYAQFGISLPHSSRLQGEIGTPIARSAALPGDVVVMDGGSHVGIYAGGGRFVDAPYPGRVVSNDLIYDNDYYIVRFGI